MFVRSQCDRLLSFYNDAWSSGTSRRRGATPAAYARLHYRALTYNYTRTLVLLLRAGFSLRHVDGRASLVIVSTAQLRDVHGVQRAYDDIAAAAGLRPRSVAVVLANAAHASQHARHGNATMDPGTCAMVSAYWAEENARFQLLTGRCVQC
jgi:hypothetical protein